jgi:cytochrome c oxidase assembly factor CtaG
VDCDLVTVSNIWWWAVVKMVMIPRLLQNGQKVDRLLKRVILLLHFKILGLVLFSLLEADVSGKTRYVTHWFLQVAEV